MLVQGHRGTKNVLGHFMDTLWHRGVPKSALQWKWRQLHTLNTNPCIWLMKMMTVTHFEHPEASKWRQLCISSIQNHQNDDSYTLWVPWKHQNDKETGLETFTIEFLRKLPSKTFQESDDIWWECHRPNNMTTPETFPRIFPGIFPGRLYNQGHHMNDWMNEWMNEWWPESDQIRPESDHVLVTIWINEWKINK